MKAVNVCFIYLLVYFVVVVFYTVLSRLCCYISFTPSCTLQEYSQHVADNPDLSESMPSTSVDVSATPSKRGHVFSSHDDTDEPACSMEDVIQLLQLLSAVASDTRSTGNPSGFFN